MADSNQTDRQLDAFDRKILDIMSQEGRLPVTELASRVGLSKSPCQARLKRLEKQGYILGYRAVINQRLLGNAHIAFVEVKLLDTKEAALRKFNDAILTVPEIEACHMIAGSFDYLLKVRTSDIVAYRQVLGEKVASLPHVANTSTYVCMQEIIDRNAKLPD